MMRLVCEDLPGHKKSEGFPRNAPRMQVVGKTPTLQYVEEHIGAEQRCQYLTEGMLYAYKA